MKLLTNGNKLVQKIFFEINEEKRYCNSKFNIVLQKESKYVIYNTLSKSLAELTNEEYQILSENSSVSPLSKPMIEAGFLVLCGCDEVLRLKELLETSKMFVNNKGIKTYTILPTFDCNARCYYCFEKSCTKNDMACETIDRLCRFIHDNYKKTQKKVVLEWYGGEPLVNSSAIDKITSYLIENGVDFSSIMISNGYLFDDNLLSKAVKLWKLKSVQITLDGTEKIYNRVKKYIDACENPFIRVLENIECLLKIDIAVNVRLNLGTNNFDDLLCLIESLSKKFGKYKKFSVYVHSLFEIQENPKNEYIWKNLNLIEEKLIASGISSIKSLNSEVLTFPCPAANPQTVTVLPDGNLCKCKTFFDESKYGDLKSRFVDEDLVDLWKEEAVRGEKCFNCPLLPTCRNLKKCNKSQVECSDAEQEYRLQHIIRRINKTVND